MTMTKSIRTAYILWLFGGLFGLHHFYLKRDKQGFIYLVTLGGFLIGFLRDIYKLPEYLNEANNQDEYFKKLKKQQSQLKAPVFITTRFLSSIVVGSFFGYVSKYCLFNSDFENNHFYLSRFIVTLLSPVMIGFVVYLIGTEGSIKCSLKWPLIGSYLAMFVDILRNSSSYYSSAILSTLFLNWNLEWDVNFLEKRNNKKLYKRLLYVSIGLVLVGSLFSLFVWNNASFKIDGKQVTLKESVYKFLESEEVKKVVQVGEMLWNFYQAHGLRRMINNFFYGFDPELIANAYKILELNERSTQEEINQKCRLLSRKWHPDKYKDADKKLTAEKIFMDVQQSCNILSEHRKNKFNQNKKSEV